MSDYTISIPSELYEKAQPLAEQTSQQVDDVIRTRLESALDERFTYLPSEEQAELKAMAYLSDNALFSMMREQMQKMVQERMSDLMDKNTRGAITDTEYAELAEFVERGNKLTLRKAQAMNYLMDRGYSVTLDDLKPIDE